MKRCNACNAWAPVGGPMQHAADCPVGGSDPEQVHLGGRRGGKTGWIGLPPYGEATGYTADEVERASQAGVPLVREQPKWACACWPNPQVLGYNEGCTKCGALAPPEALPHCGRYVTPLAFTGAPECTTVDNSDMRRHAQEALDDPRSHPDTFRAARQVLGLCTGCGDDLVDRAERGDTVCWDCVEQSVRERDRILRGVVVTYDDAPLRGPVNGGLVFGNTIATIPREAGEAWSDYAARREVLREQFPAGPGGDTAMREHLAWLAGE